MGQVFKAKTGEALEVVLHGVESFLLQQVDCLSAELICWP